MSAGWLVMAGFGGLPLGERWCSGGLLSAGGAPVAEARCCIYNAKAASEERQHSTAAQTGRQATCKSACNAQAQQGRPSTRAGVGATRRDLEFV